MRSCKQTYHFESRDGSEVGRSSVPEKAERTVSILREGRQHSGLVRGYKDGDHRAQGPAPRSTGAPRSLRSRPARRSGVRRSTHEGTRWLSRQTSVPRQDAGAPGTVLSLEARGGRESSPTAPRTAAPSQAPRLALSLRLPSHHSRMLLFLTWPQARKRGRSARAATFKMSARLQYQFWESIPGVNQMHTQLENVQMSTAMLLIWGKEQR